MDDIFIKNSSGEYIPIKLEVVSSKDLEDKLIFVTVGNDNEPATNEILEYVQQRFLKSKTISGAMRNSKGSNLLIVPHIIKLELLSNKDLDSKSICISINTNDNVIDVPELAAQIKKQIRKNVIVLPSPISLKEYLEIKTIKERIQIRKNRHGGGLSEN